MIGSRARPKRGQRDEAEKPFWISFSDLMTALMVLFLVVMAVALLAVTRTVSEREKKEAEHKQNISKCMLLAAEAAKKHPGVKVNEDRHVIDFGNRALFPFGKSTLSTDQEVVLRQFVPELISLTQMPSCKAVLKRIVVEGYTDQQGDYLQNLNLSLMRSQRVLCAMFKQQGESLLNEQQKEAVRDVFLVGGFAFNSSKKTDEESRRVEMRIEFLGVDEQRAPSPQRAPGNFGACAI
jgi:outer membrane protein OmpA-like peptidoglycan-associated protein